MYFSSIFHKGWIINPITGEGLETEKGTTRHQREQMLFHNICRECHGNHAILIWILAVNKIFLM